jgi:tRNA dimethylallyltransferase
MSVNSSVIYCLMGPTASGKTQVAVELVQRFPFEIISVDSAMVYRGLDIGTAKPSADILKMAPHRLIDIREPTDAYSAAQFRQDALREIEDIIAKNKIPLLVGGTMLYFRALQQGLSDLPSADSVIREKLTAEGVQHGWLAMHEKLKIIDPEAAQRIHPNDPQRIQRALEVYELTGINLTTWLAQNKMHPTHYQIHNLIIAPHERSILHSRIAERFQKMLSDGFIDEVRQLMTRQDLTLDTPSMRSVGYRQVWQYLMGQLSYEDMCEKGIVATRQLAKRQLTWLRSWPEAHWFDSENVDLMDQIALFLNQNKIK